MRLSHLISILALAGLTILPLTAAPARTTRDKLNTIVLPKVNFEEARLADVFTFIRQRAKALDLHGDGVNIMFSCDKELLEQEVTLSFENIPLGEALRYICMGTGLHYRVERHAVVVADQASEKDRMEMRVFYMEPGLLRGNHQKGDKDFGTE